MSKRKSSNMTIAVGLFVISIMGGAIAGGDGGPFPYAPKAFVVKGVPAGQPVPMPVLREAHMLTTSPTHRWFVNAIGDAPQDWKSPMLIAADGPTNNDGLYDLAFVAIPPETPSSGPNSQQMWASAEIERRPGMSGARIWVEHSCIIIDWDSNSQQKDTKDCGTVH